MVCRGTAEFRQGRAGLAHQGCVESGKVRLSKGRASPSKAGVVRFGEAWHDAIGRDGVRLGAAGEAG